MTKLVAVLAVALLTALPLACGRKGAPIAPQLVQPEPPEALAAVVTPDGVRLNWLRPLRYSGGARMNDLEGFAVERAVARDGRPEYHEIGEVTLDDQNRFRKERRIEWLDKTAIQGTKYLYRVTAKTLDDYESPAAGPVAVQYGPPATP